MSNLVKTYYDIGKLVIWGDEAPEGDQQKRSRLVFGCPWQTKRIQSDQILTLEIPLPASVERLDKELEQQRKSG